MNTIAAPMPRKRRVTADEERQLLELKQTMRDLEQQIERTRAQRDCLIADLIENGARQVDVAEILELTERAVSDARQRARRA